MYKYIKCKCYLKKFIPHHKNYIFIILKLIFKISEGRKYYTDYNYIYYFCDIKIIKIYSLIKEYLNYINTVMYIKFISILL